jgi:glycosyltransferase involved in cell wall biosynthesis
MRILLLCNKSPWPPRDGGSAATLSMIRGLSALNTSVTVLALNTSKHHTNPDEMPPDIIRGIDIKLIDIDTEISRIKLITNLLFSGKPYNLQRFSSVKYSQELVNILRNKFDIIQIEGLSMYHYLEVIKRHTSIPVVFRPHNAENRIWSLLADEEETWFKRIYFNILARRIKKIEKHIINKFDAIVPISPPDLKWFRTEGLSIPSIVVSPGYFHEEIEEYSHSDTQKVFFIGALDWLPNIYGLKWFIREVWPVIIRRIPRAEFFIAGRNASGKTISGLGGPNIFFIGETDSSAAFIKDKTVMVVPLFSGSGIRIKIIEGMSQGKSVVATAIAAEGLDYEDRKDIFISSGPEEFADNLTLLIQNPDLRKEVGENAIKNVRKNYNILASSEKLINFYRELLHDN